MPAGCDYDDNLPRRSATGRFRSPVLSAANDAAFSRDACKIGQRALLPADGVGMESVVAFMPCGAPEAHEACYDFSTPRHVPNQRLIGTGILAHPTLQAASDGG